MSDSNVVIYLFRRDLRVADNPILHHLATAKHGYTNLLPIYVYSANQIEVSGFIPESCSDKSPYSEARSHVAGYWRCGPHRAKFIAESVTNLKESLRSLNSGLAVRVGMPAEVIADVVTSFQKAGTHVGAVWTVREDGVEEKQDEAALASLCREKNIEFRLWHSEKYFIDDNKLLDNPHDVPEVFTAYRKSIEPLREKPQPCLPKPEDGKLPNFIDPPPQRLPFVVPDDPIELERCLLAPLQGVIREVVDEYERHRPAVSASTDNQPETGGDEEETAEDAEAFVSAHPFRGGEDEGLKRLKDLFSPRNGTLIFNYDKTREGLLGTGYSTKLSAYLSQGCITARQINHYLVHYEDGDDDSLASAMGYGGGQNQGTETLRIELLWRDYQRLCARRHPDSLFRLTGFRGEKEKNSRNSDTSSEPTRVNTPKSSPVPETATVDPLQASLPSEERPGAPNLWKTANAAKAAKDQEPSPEQVGRVLQRLQAGLTGHSLIDASQRELLHTGYTSNRARQNVAIFLAKNLGIDWRYGAEWYEMMLVDYDVCSNWANWQYMAGVGYDPRGTSRIFNPVKQASDYDPEGKYVRSWLPEYSGLREMIHLYQPASAPAQVAHGAGLAEHPAVSQPVLKISFHPAGKRPEKPHHDAYRGSRSGSKRGAHRGRGRTGGSGGEVLSRALINNVPREPGNADTAAAASMLTNSHRGVSAMIVTSSSTPTTTSVAPMATSNMSPLLISAQWTQISGPEVSPASHMHQAMAFSAGPVHTTMGPIQTYQVHPAPLMSPVMPASPHLWPNQGVQASPGPSMSGVTGYQLGFGMGFGEHMGAGNVQGGYGYHHGGHGYNPGVYSGGVPQMNMSMQLGHHQYQSQAGRGGRGRGGGGQRGNLGGGRDYHGSRGGNRPSGNW